MPQRLAAIVALLAFAVCLIVGGLEAGNPFVTTVGRALTAMAGTFVVGLVVGAMGQRAIAENLASVAAKTAVAANDSTPKPAPATPPETAVKPNPAAGR